MGMVMVQTSPSGRKSRCPAPCSSWARPLSITRVPKPRWEGVLIAGPPTSAHVRTRRDPCGDGSTFQAICTLPPALERAPYFSALVASSLNTMQRSSAALGGKRTGGPLTMKRSQCEPTDLKGARVSWMISCRPAPFHFSRVSSSWERERAASHDLIICRRVCRSALERKACRTTA